MNIFCLNIFRKYYSVVIEIFQQLSLKNVAKLYFVQMEFLLLQKVTSVYLKNI